MYTANQIRRRIRSYLRSAVLSKMLVESKFNNLQDKNPDADKQSSSSEKKTIKDSK